MTFFSNIQHRFPPVGEDGLIEAEPFLSAADEILLIIGKFYYCHLVNAPVK